MKLVKFSCGCVGTEPIDGQSVIFKTCDGGGDISFYKTNRCQQKTHEPLDTVETDDIINETSKLISNGYDFRKMKQLLK